MAIPKRYNTEFEFSVVLADGTWNVPATGSMFRLTIGIWQSLSGVK